ncbi:MAG: hypothetical protein BGO51_00420 [Rhodospirillales bacterium 69-11]|nr:hypothetical protein [Rhodospirillales bacterium]MBN8925258.1 hypothetical protein [Rhodospirillales bacterium]OJW26914.1 MAG: hypothetical protein BGO51_00420 [Rhodospirillales bacterium 69-11]
MSENEAVMRWDPYSLTYDSEFDDFWRGHLARRERRLLLVLGKGFDVRALETARRLRDLRANAEVWLLAFHNGQDDSELRRKRTDQNAEGLAKLFDVSRIKEVDIDIGSAFGSPVASVNTYTQLRTAGDPTQFDDVVIDISAMPRMVAMTTVAVLLKRLDDADRTGKRVNLHVAVAESVSADLKSGQGSLRDQVSFVRGFSGELTAQTTEDLPRVWFPVLGESQSDRLDKIHQHLTPDEICPVVPFPSREPRRGDEIIYAHRDILFDTFQVEPRNILLACEYNPFEAYKQIFEAMDRYRRALSELGGCKAFVSPLSSKLLSIAVLLACYDHLFGDVPGKRLKVGIPYVETAVYADPVQEPDTPFELYSMWIRGEWELVDASAAGALTEGVGDDGPIPAA